MGAGLGGFAGSASRAWRGAHERFEMSMERVEQPGLVARLREFIKEVRIESTKVSWPSRQELRDSTLVVIVAVLIVSAFVGAVDQLLTMLVRVLFR